MASANGKTWQQQRSRGCCVLLALSRGDDFNMCAEGKTGMFVRVSACVRCEVCSTKEWRGPTERRIRLQLDGSERRNMVPHVLRKSSPSVHGDNPSPPSLFLFPSLPLLHCPPPPLSSFPNYSLLPWFTADRNKAKAGVMGWMLGQKQHWTLCTHTHMLRSRKKMLTQKKK